MAKSAQEVGEARRDAEFEAAQLLATATRLFREQVESGKISLVSNPAAVQAMAQLVAALMPSKS